jgi:glucuronoarabinoxylan endo-1,4-beta-xylanase
MSHSLWKLLKRIRREERATNHKLIAIRRHQFEQLEPRMLLSASTVNWTDVRQTIDGFGASSAWAWGTWSTQTMDYLYSPVTGAGLTLLRSRVAPNVGTSENLIMEQAAAYGALVWSTPWTPPREWKTNHDTANGGSLDPAHYQDYATALADYVQDVARQGISLYALSIQNEPNWTADYESCRWTAQQFADFLPYLGQTFAARGIATKIMLPEQLNWDFSLASIIMANSTLSQYVGILAAHNYGEYSGSWKPCTIAGGRSVWETEISSFVETDLGSAIDTADDIHQAMTDGNANAYHYWWLNASGYSGLLDNGTPTKRLWAMAQYSRFVRPGWVRIGETDDGGLDITTFKDPVSGKFAVVVVNTGTTDINEGFTLSGVTVTSVTPYVTSSTQNLVQGTAITLTGGTTFSATIAAQSIVTFYGQSSTAATLQAPTDVSASPVQGYTTSRVALAWSDNSSSETAYTVERSTDGSNWTVLTSTLATDSISYIDTGRAENSLYYYRVKPTNGDATTYSAVVSTSMVLQAPSNVNGLRVSNGINLTWTINSSVSTGMVIDRSLDGLTWTNIANLATRATSYSDVISGYNANQIYYYRVRNTIGSNYSALAGWNTGLAAPTNFAVAGATTSSVTLTWTSPLGASGAWIEQYNSSSSNWSSVSPGSLQASDGTYTITGLSGGTSYTFRMRTSSDADSVYSSYTSLIASTATPSVNPVVWYKADES